MQRDSSACLLAQSYSMLFGGMRSWRGPLYAALRTICGAGRAAQAQKRLKLPTTTPQMVSSLPSSGCISGTSGASACKAVLRPR